MATEEKRVHMTVLVPEQLRRDLGTYCTKHDVGLSALARDAFVAAIAEPPAALTTSNGQTNGDGKLCLRPGCGAKRRTRGLCEACYRIALTLTRAKRTTWEKLEAAGRITKMVRGRPTSAALRESWLLGNGKAH